MYRFAFKVYKFAFKGELAFNVKFAFKNQEEVLKRNFPFAAYKFTTSSVLNPGSRIEKYFFHLCTAVLSIHATTVEKKLQLHATTVVKKIVGGGIKPLCINVAEFANYTYSTQTIKYVHVNIEKALYHIYSMLPLAEFPKTEKCDV